MTILNANDQKGEFERLGEVFIRAVTRAPDIEHDDRLDIAQGIMCTISQHADDILNYSVEGQDQILEVVAKVLGCCATVAENSDSSSIQKFALEIREQAEYFQPATA